MVNGSRVRTVNVKPKAHSKPKSKDERSQSKKAELDSSRESESDRDGMDNSNTNSETSDEETESSDQDSDHYQPLPKDALKSKESFKSWVKGVYKTGTYNYLAPDPRAVDHQGLGGSYVCIFFFQT